VIYHNRIVIDTDAGIDDSVALALAARSPELQILAVTTTYGNAPLDLSTRNARRVLELAGSPHIPVLPGAWKPIARPLVTAPETHGASGVGYAPVPPPRPGGAVPRPRVLLDVLRATPGPITLVTLGPLTNLAIALRADRSLVRSRVACHLGMFGNINERGNTNRWADFNAWSDPEAADEIVRSALPTTMVGLDVTRQMTMSAREVERLRGSQDPLVAWLAEALQFYVEFHRSQERLDGCVVNDILPIGELIRPGLLSGERLGLRVALDEGEHRGHTKSDVRGSMTNVALQVDIAGMRKLLIRVFGKRWLEGAHR
jgi:purine nucleosidase